MLLHAVEEMFDDDDEDEDNVEFAGGETDGTWRR